MKRILTYTLLIFTIAQFLFGSGCKKEEIPTATLTTSTITNITGTSASSGGNITDDGGSTVTVRGVCWSTGTTPTTADSKTTNGAGAGTFTSSITGLTTGTIYYVRAYATNASGTGYGMAMSFTTQPATTPELTTANVTIITRNTATCGGTITSDGAASITARGVCWNKTQNPTIANSKTTDGAGTGAFSSSITLLVANTTYYLRAYATNSAGTAYGNELIFKTYTGTVTDVDGNVYYTVTIGTQVWMAENLKVTHYRNGEPIPNVTDNSAWYNLTTGAYCDYNNTPGNSTTYGKLYNWYAMCDSRNIAPTGWHVPSETEWNVLTNYLGGKIVVYPWSTVTVVGGKMKETGTIHWLSPNYGATNESGFTALPGGNRDTGSTYSPFVGIGRSGYWWSSSGSDPSRAWCRYLGYSVDGMDIYECNKQSGYSVRCVRD